MKKRTQTGILYAVCLLAILGFSIKFTWLMIVPVILVAFFGSMEMGHVLSKKFRPIAPGWILAGSLLALVPLAVRARYPDLGGPYLLREGEGVAAYWQTDLLWLLGLSVTVTAAALMIFGLLKILIQVLTKGAAILPHSVAELAAAYYLAMPMSLLLILTFTVPDGFKWVTLAVLMPSVTDVAAYYVGSFFGNRPLLPRLSPHKTVAGFLGGLVAPTILVGLVFMAFFRGESPLRPGLLENFLWGAVIGFVLSLASQMGDWLASAIKRYCGVKDFSNLLPGHGGLLDRLDSVLVAIPTAVLAACAYYLI